MKKIIALILLTIPCFIIFSCNKDDSDPEPVQGGKITGKLVLTDEFGIPMTDHSHMNISNGSTSAISTVAGNYQLMNLAGGTYNLTFQKSGFGTYKRFNIQVMDGNSNTILNGVDTLGQKSTTEISNLSITFNLVDSTYSIGCSIAPVPSASTPRAFRLFFGENDPVTDDDYLYTPSNSWVATTSTGIITGIPRSVFYNSGFTVGQTVRCIAYGESIRTNVYTIPVTNKKVFPNLNTSAPSNMVTFILQ